MKKLLNDLCKQHSRAVKRFKFWSGIAEKANHRAKLEHYRCQQISNEIDKVQSQTTQEIDKLKEVEV